MRSPIIWASLSTIVVSWCVRRCMKWLVNRIRIRWFTNEVATPLTACCRGYIMRRRFLDRATVYQPRPLVRIPKLYHHVFKSRIQQRKLAQFHSDVKSCKKWIKRFQFLARSRLHARRAHENWDKLSDQYKSLLNVWPKEPKNNYGNILPLVLGEGEHKTLSLPQLIYKAKPYYLRYKVNDALEANVIKVVSQFFEGFMKVPVNQKRDELYIKRAKGFYSVTDATTYKPGKLLDVSMFDTIHQALHALPPIMFTFKNFDRQGLATIGVMVPDVLHRQLYTLQVRYSSNGPEYRFVEFVKDFYGFPIFSFKKVTSITDVRAPPPFYRPVAIPLDFNLLPQTHPTAATIIEKPHSSIIGDQVHASPPIAVETKVQSIPADNSSIVCDYCDSLVDDNCGEKVGEMIVCTRCFNRCNAIVDDNIDIIDPSSILDSASPWDDISVTVTPRTNLLPKFYIQKEDGSVDIWLKCSNCSETFTEYRDSLVFQRSLYCDVCRPLFVNSANTHKQLSYKRYSGNYKEGLVEATPVLQRYKLSNDELTAVPLLTPEQVSKYESTHKLYNCKDGVSLVNPLRAIVDIDPKYIPKGVASLWRSFTPFTRQSQVGWLMNQLYRANSIETEFLIDLENN